MVRKITIASCALNQWAMDFTGNLERILRSCQEAKEHGATYRLGPELEIPGYGCEDHFLENDTITHSWEVLGEILKSSHTENIMCDFGMPVLYKAVRYNCRVIVYNHRILLIRPKLNLAMSGNYREARWFTPWARQREIESFNLPSIITDITGQTTVPFGDGVIETQDAVIGSEICEELFTAQSTHISQGLDGVEIFTNGSASHFNLRKLYTRVEAIVSATRTCGGVYMYSNILGCDGGRLYFDGCCLISLNDGLVAQGPQFTLAEIDITMATVDLDDVIAYRGNTGSRGPQTGHVVRYPRVNVPVRLCQSDTPVTENVNVHYYMPEEEIMLGPSAWLWDYLRRSNMAGFFLPLSGGIDSSSTACLVGVMCDSVIQACHNGNAQVIKDIRKVLRLKPNDPMPCTGQEIAGFLFTTCYMESSNSSSDTKRRAETLANQIGSRHLSISIDNVVSSCLGIFQDTTNLVPKFKVHGGSNTENLALQNIQARSRMVLSYLFAQLIPWTTDTAGSMLVLGSANVDESLYGYFTKYDCSSADINPIGGISKTDLRSFCKFMSQTKYPALNEIIRAPPTAELEPISDSYCQIDENDMGLTYSELSDIGRLRNVHHCGPFSMFIKLLDKWRDRYTPDEIADKVKRFFRSHSMNRHKMTTLTPSCHAESYSPDDNRHDLRQFLYNVKWVWQFTAIDSKLQLLSSEKSKLSQDMDQDGQGIYSTNGANTTDVVTSSQQQVPETNFGNDSNDGFMTASTKDRIGLGACDDGISTNFTESPHPTITTGFEATPTSNNPAPIRKRSRHSSDVDSDVLASKIMPDKRTTPTSWMQKIFKK